MFITNNPNCWLVGKELFDYIWENNIFNYRSYREMIRIVNKNGLIDPTLHSNSVSFLKKAKSKEFRIKQNRKRWKIRRGIS